MRILSLAWALFLASAATAATLHKAEEIDTIKQKASQHCSDLPENCNVILTDFGSSFRAGVLRQSTQSLDEAALKLHEEAKSARCVGVMNDCAMRIKQNGGT
ncbi:hypothetical protein G6O67_006963 [Ophiocordyceps sinensis]|uniref:Pectinesterase inhibitor domain-containing protein n=1 Tax=Ophiocordyceps sinensis TaxID=72228 RepID=A0A8H4LT52_9HYPO|nr:hypothetical protein G6O67_006963 [Ophiocordyceps sinensis]